MFDGVGWAAGEIVVFMLIATLIGFAIGWIFGRWLQRGSIAEEYETALAAERELTKRAESRLAAGTSDLDKALLEVKAERGKAGEASAELEAAQSSVADLEAKLAELEHKDAEIQRLETELTTKADAEAKLEAEAAAKSDVEAKLEAKLEEAMAAKADVEAQLQAKLDEAASETADLEAQLAQLADKDSAIDRLTTELEACGADRDRQLAARDERIAALETELAAAELPPSPAPEPATIVEVAAQPEPVADLAAEPSKEEGLSRIAEIAARTAGEGAVADDDLKKVRGIGPKLERTLKDLGITSFRQIANFRKDDIAFVTAALDAFKGRIERDDWMSSAAAEHLKKYNEPA